MASSSAVVMPGWRFAFIASRASLTTRPASRRAARSLSDSTVMRGSFLVAVPRSVRWHDRAARGLFAQVPVGKGVLGGPYPSSCIATVLMGQERPLGSPSLDRGYLHVVVLNRVALR